MCDANSTAGIDQGNATLFSKKKKSKSLPRAVTLDNKTKHVRGYNLLLARFGLNLVQNDQDSNDAFGA